MSLRTVLPVGVPSFSLEDKSCNYPGGHYLMVNTFLSSLLSSLVHLYVLISWRAGADESMIQRL